MKIRETMVDQELIETKAMELIVFIVYSCNRTTGRIMIITKPIFDLFL